MPRRSGDLRRDNDLLSDIRMAAADAIEWTRDRTLATFLEDPVLIRAIERLIFVTGEAATQIDDALVNKFPSRHWKGLRGMRVKLTHSYDVVDPRILWDTIRDDFPDLIVFVDELLKQR